MPNEMLKFDSKVILLIFSGEGGEMSFEMKLSTIPEQSKLFSLISSF